MTTPKTVNVLLVVSIVFFIAPVIRPALAENSEEQAGTTQVHLIAGELDENHPRTAHRYKRDVQLLTKWLSEAPNLDGLKATAHFNGWPENPAALNDADTVVVISSGGNRKRSMHPLLRGDRLDVVEKQMDRGCGLVIVHWATFVPQGRPADSFLEWVGGYFDYQSEKSHPKNWYSRIKIVQAPVRLGSPDHPIRRGVEPFVMRDEYYYRMQFRKEAPKPEPILIANLPGVEKPQTVGWALQRPGGGRGFAYTGGHFHRNWRKDAYRTAMLNAIVWTAGAAVPEGGVASSVDEGELSVQK